LGQRDRDLPGKQKNFVFLDFGHPYEQDSVLGTQSPFPGQHFATLDDIKELVYQYARGYWHGTAYDLESTVLIGIGVSNYDNQGTTEDYVTAEHGEAWANMIIDTRNYIKQGTNDSLQVDEAAAMDIELNYNSPEDTKVWIDEVNSTFLAYEDPDPEHAFYIIDIGDAKGCPFEPSDNDYTNSNWGNSCKADFSFDPQWSPDYIRYFAFGCPRCYPVPMIYTKDWTNAAQWTMISRWSYYNYYYPINFWGSMTEYRACEHKGIVNSDPLCNTAEDGYKKFYSALNTFDETMDDLDWSADMDYQD
jgi:hypothetical protein